MKNYYDILGIKKGASFKEIKQAYRDLSKKHHPDVNGTGCDEEMKNITEAFDVLSDTKKRSFYDKYGYAEGSAGLNGIITFLTGLINDILMKTQTEPDMFPGFMKFAMIQTRDKYMQDRSKIRADISRLGQAKKSFRTKKGKSPAPIMEMAFNSLVADATKHLDKVTGDIKFADAVLDFLEVYDFQDFSPPQQTIVVNGFNGRSTYE